MRPADFKVFVKLRKCLIPARKCNKTFPQQTFSFVTVGEAQVLLVTLTLSVPGSHDSVTTSQRAHYGDC